MDNLGELTDNLGELTDHEIFVYGTLKPGCSNYHFYEQFVIDSRKATIHADLYSLGQIPGIKNLGSENIVKGYVIKTDNIGLQSFDALEGHPMLYLRTPVITIEGDNVWVYVYNGEVQDYARIEHGDFQEIMVNLNNNTRACAIPLEPVIEGEYTRLVMNNQIYQARLK